MQKELTVAERQRLQTLWDISQTEPAYKDMLNEMRQLEKRYEEVIEKNGGRGQRDRLRFCQPLRSNELAYFGNRQSKNGVPL